MKMRTREKIRLARLLFRGVRLLRWGKSPIVRASRRGIRYELDLREGIDLALYVFGVFEPDTKRVLQHLVRPGDVVVDIGANVGAHTLHLARRVRPGGRVIAIEPTDYAYAKLRRNLALNPGPAACVTTLQVLLGDGLAASGRPDAVYASWRLDLRTGQHPKHFGSLMLAGGARRATLDVALEEVGVAHVDLVKIDVDGNEGHVWRGARRMLEVDRPIVVTELCPYALAEAGDSAEAMLRSFWELGYRLHDERDLGVLPDDAATILRLIPADSSINVVALPSGDRPRAT